jgi:hypothetical protein
MPFIGGRVAAAGAVAGAGAVCAGPAAERLAARRRIVAMRRAGTNFRDMERFLSARVWDNFPLKDSR